eukprot:2902607-Amphidinium_carterae.2
MIPPCETQFVLCTCSLPAAFPAVPHKEVRGHLIQPSSAHVLRVESNARVVLVVEKALAQKLHVYH